MMNTERFPKRVPNLREEAAAWTSVKFFWLRLSWVSESFRQDIGSAPEFPACWQRGSKEVYILNQSYHITYDNYEEIKRQETWTTGGPRICFCSEDSSPNFPVFQAQAVANYQASVVQRLDSAIHRITLYPVDSAISFPNTYPRDSDLSGG